MKKLILSAAIVLGGLTAATAQTEKETTAINEQKQTAVEAQVESRLDAAQDVDATVATEATVAAEAVNADVVATTVATVAVQDYKEVKTSAVPQTIQDAVAKDFSGATISKAYVNANGEYKLDLATADKKAATVYTDAKGQWIKNAKKKQ